MCGYELRVSAKAIAASKHLVAGSRKSNTPNALAQATSWPPQQHEHATCTTLCSSVDLTNLRLPVATVKSSEILTAPCKGRELCRLPTLHELRSKCEQKHTHATVVFDHICSAIHNVPNTPNAFARETSWPPSEHSNMITHVVQQNCAYRICIESARKPCKHREPSFLVLQGLVCKA